MNDTTRWTIKESRAAWLVVALVGTAGVVTALRDAEANGRPSKAVNKENVMSSEGREVAVLAGGCFWGVEDLIRKIPGVLETDVGYAGGKLDAPTYRDVKTGETGHAEAVRIVFDPKQVSFETILDHFFRMHDPTTPNRQGNDVGTQYRSAIFAQSEAQRRTAEAVKQRVDASGKWKKPLVTEIVDGGKFFTAEDYHQDYLVKNPGGYTCHYYRD